MFDRSVSSSLCIAAIFVIAACSGGAARPDGGTGGGATGGAAATGGSAATGGRGGQGGQGTGGGGGQGGNPACASAVAQGSCTGEGTVCSNGCTDICQFCNLLRCQGGRWTAMEVAPAPCFMCGPSLRCQTNAQYCYAVMGGAVTNPPSYQCRATPNACLPTPTCSCLQGQSIPGAGNCQQGGTGEVTVTLLAP